MIKLDHVAVEVSNLEAAIDFYEQKIGLKFLFKKVDKAHGEAFAYLEMEGGRLELLQSLRLKKIRGVDSTAGVRGDLKGSFARLSGESDTSGMYASSGRAAASPAGVATDLRFAATRTRPRQKRCARTSRLVAAPTRCSHPALPPVRRNLLLLLNAASLAYSMKHK